MLPSHAPVVIECPGGMPGRRKHEGNYNLGGGFKYLISFNPKILGRFLF